MDDIAEIYHDKITRFLSSKVKTSKDLWATTTNNMKTTENYDENTISLKGVNAPAENFTGTVYVQMLIPKSEQINYSIGSVTFEAGARSNCHTHPAGQNLLVTDGVGLYQEKGKPVKTLNKGDVIFCDPDIEHWHGASADAQMTHLAVTNYTNIVAVVWFKPVTDKEYKGDKK